MTPHTCLHVSSSANLNGIAAGRAVLESFSLAPHLVPDRYGNYEPIRTQYTATDLDTVLEDWRDPFLWKRSRPRSDGGIWMAHDNHPRHSTLVLRVRDYKRVSDGELLSLLHGWATRCSGDVGLLHLFTDSELDRAKKSGALSALDRAGTRYSFNLPSHELQTCLPDFYWAMIFGRPYIDMFGHDRLLSAPAHIARDLPSGHVFIQLTESLLDLETDYPRVTALRHQVIDHLGADAFFSPERTLYRTPKFTFYKPGSR